VRVPRLPVDTCVADSQGGMGYMIQRLALEMFRREGIRRHVATIITQVLVAGDDPEFAHPTKPIGQYYSAEEAGRLGTEKPHWNLRLVDRGLYRRVVRPASAAGDRERCDPGVIGSGRGGRRVRRRRDSRGLGRRPYRGRRGGG